MSMRYKGGVISATPPTVTTSSAKGVWTLEQQMQYQAAGVWPSSVISDPFFEYVTMLLHGDGTNGAQNNTFLDSSTNNFSITRNGDTTQGTFSPFSRADGNWSNYFDGDTDYLSWTGTALTGNFTVECWVYKTAVDASGYTNVFYGAGNDQFAIDQTTTGSISLVLGGSVVIAASGTAVTNNAWHHLAWVREGTTCRMYVNGVQQGSGTSSASFTLSVIGRYGVGGFEMNGYISNVRITNACLYPSGTTFTPSITPLTTTVSTGTVQLLTCQSNRFKDNSTNAFAITVNGNTSVQVFNPFNPTTAYLAATNGGSGYFDGSGDTLTIANNAAFNLDSGDATIEAWVYYTSQPGATGQVIFDCMVDNVSGYNFYSYPYGAGGIAIGMQSFNGGYQQIYTTNNPIPVGVWAHVAYTRASGTNRFFVNGVQCTTNTGSFTSSLATGGNTIYVGGRVSGNPFYGYISNLRVLKGTAQYTANFTPPTAPFTNITNTSVLLNFTNGGIFDNAAMNDLVTVGNAQISTSVVKFGTGSLAFDGGGDLLQMASTQNVAFGTGDFTIEFWMNSNNVGTQQRGPLQISTTAGGVTASYGAGIAVLQGSTSTGTLLSGGLAVVFGTGGSSFTGAGSSTAVITTGVWYHVAITRASGSVRLFVDGVQNGSTITYTTDLTSSNLALGGQYSAQYFYDGYLDDLRITKGYARYTSNFTAPTAPFPNL